jgi:hypothetical protein
MSEFKERSFNIRIGHFNFYTTGFYHGMSEKDFEDWNELKKIKPVFTDVKESLDINVNIC